MSEIGIRGASYLAYGPGDPPGALDAAFAPLWGTKFRKIGRFIKLALTGAGLAARNAGLAEFPKDRTGVFMGTGLGNLTDLIAFSEHALDGKGYPSPIQFANSVGNAGAFYIAMGFELRGPVLAVCQDEVSFEAAVLNAVTLLAAGDIDIALAGGVDVCVPPASDHLARMGYASSAAENMTAGEGSGWLVLERREAGHRVVLEGASLSYPEDAAAALRERLSSASREHDTFLALGLRLASITAGAQALSERVRLVERLPGAFSTETAAMVGRFLAAPPTPSVLHSFAATCDGLVGTLDIRVLA